MIMPIRILIAEHDPGDLELIHHELKTGGIKYESEIIQTEKAYIDALKNFMPHIILADYSFPTFNGAIAFALKEKLAPDTAFIFVSGIIGEEKAVQLIRNGATDYVLKDKLFTLNSKLKRALKEAKEKQHKKETDEKLLLSEKRLARAQQVAHMGSWELDFSNNAVRWSDEACRIYGVPSDNFKQSLESASAFIHPEDIKVVLEKINSSRDFLLDYAVNYRIVHKSGNIRYIYSEGKLDFGPNGKPRGLFGIVHDVTQTALLEKELEKERRAKQSDITAAVLKAQENERFAIGEELQESLTQILGASKLYIDLAKKDKIHREMFLEKASDYIVDVIGKIRKISKALSSPGTRMSLFTSIKILLDDLAIANPIKINFNTGGIDETCINEQLQQTIFRIIQEQVSNILKHATATRAVIGLTKKHNNIILLISDNGTGDSSIKKLNGVGIKNIRSRADLYNGTVTITSNPGKGYELKVVLCLTNIYDPERVDAIT